MSKCKHNTTTLELFDESRITPFGVSAEVCEDCSKVLEVM